MTKSRKSSPAAVAQPKLTGRTRFQVKAAEKYLDGDLVAATTSSTITFTELRNRDWIAARVAAAIEEAQSAGRKGDSVALHSLQRAMVEQWGDTLSPGAVAAIHEGEAEPVEAPKPAKAAKKATKAAVKAPKAPKADAAGKVTAELPAGYELRWPHGSYDLWKKTDKAVEGPAWLVVCNAHGTFMAAANAKAGDVLGSKAGRASWCTGCR